MFFHKLRASSFVISIGKLHVFMSYNAAGLWLAYFWLIFGALYKRTEALEKVLIWKFSQIGGKIIGFFIIKQIKMLRLCSVVKKVEHPEVRKNTRLRLVFSPTVSFVLSLGFSPFAKLLKVIVQSFCQVMNFVLNKPLLLKVLLNPWMHFLHSWWRIFC